MMRQFLPRLTVTCLLALALVVLNVNTVQGANIVLPGDNRDAGFVVDSSRLATTVELFGRRIELFVSDRENAIFGVISNGDPNDEIWLDRSFDGGFTWSQGAQLGISKIPGGSRSVRTNLFTVDGEISPNGQQIGALRACGTPNNLPDISCTSWHRSTVHANNRLEAAATALMQFYNSEGVFSTNGWWTSANGLTAMIDYMKVTMDRFYFFILDNTFEKNKNKQFGNFTNDYIDDVGWWGLAWVGAYDLTGDRKYLDMAQIDADFMYQTRDDKCGGGIWWTIRKDYKNAIPNELFIKLAAALHNRLSGDEKYLRQAIDVYDWFMGSGMVNSNNLINDGLRDNCQNNGDPTWTYNQGVILGGMVELYKATGDRKYVDRGRQIADAVLRSEQLNPGGVLREVGENGEDGDGASFKGAFMRNFGELNAVLADRPYTTYLKHVADVVYSNRNSLNQYGAHYAGPFDHAPGNGKQHSAFEALIAAER